MPHVNIWIRNEDLKAWKEIGDKPTFIHDAIKVQNSIKIGSMYPKVIKTPKDAVEASTRIGLSHPDKSTGFTGLCRDHGTPLDYRGKCLQKGCKYA